MGEAHVSAEQSEAGQATWVPPSHVDPRRPGHPARSAPQGSPPPLGVGLTVEAASRRHQVWRIRDRSTFAALRRDGARARRGPVTVTFLARDDDQPPRVAYAVGRAVGGAVARNRLRRRLRAIVAEAAPGLAPGAWLVAAGTAASALSFCELRTIVLDLLADAPRRPRPARR